MANASSILLLPNSLFCGTSNVRLQSHQNSTPTLSKRLFLASASGLWDAITDGNSAREAVIAIRRGMSLFKQGDISGSLLEFDKAIELDPRQKAYLWQRGLSLYYLNRYEEGAEQFRIDVAENPNDTEESIWCFLCEAQLYGVDEARRRFLEVYTYLNTYINCFTGIYFYKNIHMLDWHFKLLVEIVGMLGNGYLSSKAI
ncbi:hypothetical protein F511_44822 [Dorcoceras hygrometricum]|uniref:Uncharacterized protein n=1 Tax=Dorcoceras hygrometricum TaxID=472368 RepID=A0A2Z6ZYK8_9LAMI|nr:hypothetical protein F511_44822 [Dorcoceras hygrometricum]